MSSEDQSIWEKLWHGVIFWAVILTALDIPIGLLNNDYINMNIQLIADGLISSLFVIDLFYNYRQRKKQHKHDRRKKTHQKDRNLLILDIFASIPFLLIGHIFGLNSMRVFSIIRIVRLIRITKLFALFGDIAVLPLWLKMQLILISSGVVIHWIACGWMALHPVLPGQDFLTQYNISFYWAVTTLTTIGYGDITPTSNLARSFTMVIMVLGVGVYGIVIGNVSRIMAERNRHKEKTREKFNDLSMFMKHYKIPFRLQRDVYNFYNHLTSKRLSDNDQQIIGELPHALQAELQTYMNMRLIGNLPVFKDCSLNCLKAVSKALEQHFYSPGQKIINKGEIGNEMFIIVHGAVDVQIEKEIVASLHEGQFFGEAALIHETERNADIMAQTYCDLYMLSKESFQEIIVKYPELLKNIEKVTKKRGRRKDDSKKAA